MYRNRSLLALIIGLFVISISTLRPARADGLLLIDGVYRQPAVSHIAVTIKNKIATTTLEETFQNTLNKQVSAIYVAPVPQGATVTNFAEQIDGKWVEASIKSSEAAKADFNTAASQGQDASITTDNVTTAPGVDLQHTFQTKLVLPAKASRSVRLAYTEVLAGEVGLTRYTYPLAATNLSDEPIGDLQVSVTISDTSEIRSVSSPSHPQVEVSRTDANNFQAVYRAQNVKPTQNFELLYTQSSDQFGLNLASYREKDSEDGYFVLVAAPQLDAKATEIIQKDFVFVLDRSGSMGGPKITQAKKVMSHILDSLHTGDRFTMLTFDDKLDVFSKELVSVDQRDQAKAWVDKIEARGGTDINAAMLAALNTVDRSSDRPHIIIFATDGQATSGVTSTLSILRNVKDSIRPQTRIYTVGIGDDVNQPLLEELAQANRGNSLFVTTVEQLETPLNKFYAAIDSPVLVDLALDYGGMQVYDVQPSPIPDMFLGGQVVVTGRYKGSGAATITLTGNINGKKHVSTYPNIKFIDKSADAQPYSYVARLWAQRQIDSKVRTIALEGPTNDLVDQVTQLGLRYQIVTPYTSFVVTQPTQKQNPDLGTAVPTPRGLPYTGLPFLYVDDYRTVNTLLMITGAALIGIGLVSLKLARSHRHRLEH